MMKMNSRLAILFLALLLMLQVPSAVLACATCGCSEVCTVTMMDDATHGSHGDSLLSNSIWGNMILKMAYERDPKLRRLRGIKRTVGTGTTATLGAAAAGSLAQGTTSIVTLNPPDGDPDSYAPGIIGLCLVGATNAALWGRTGLNAGLSYRVHARQKQIRQKVESILQHLEFSETCCPEARQQLAEIIGEKAANECIDLWQSSHAIAAAN